MTGPSRITLPPAIAARVAPYTQLRVPPRRCTALQEGEWCTGTAHYDGDPAERPWPTRLRECPIYGVTLRARRLAAEQERLAGLLGRCRGGLQAWDPTRVAAGLDHLEAVRSWASQRPPRHGLLIAGGIGVGKTHLAVSAHLELVGAGVVSHYVSSTDLREMARGCAAYDEDRAEEAHQQRDVLCMAQVIVWDDAGDVDGDQRRRGEFAEHIKYLLDRSRAVWCVTTNLTAAEWRRHPDVGAKTLSRVLQGAQILHIWGQDQRMPRRRS